MKASSPFHRRTAPTVLNPFRNLRADTIHNLIFFYNNLITSLSVHHTQIPIQVDTWMQTPNFLW